MVKILAQRPTHLSAVATILIIIKRERAVQFNRLSMHSENTHHIVFVIVAATNKIISEPKHRDLPLCTNSYKVRKWTS